MSRPGGPPRESENGRYLFNPASSGMFLRQALTISGVRTVRVSELASCTLIFSQIIADVTPDTAKGGEDCGDKHFITIGQLAFRVTQGLFDLLNHELDAFFWNTGIEGAGRH